MRMTRTTLPLFDRSGLEAKILQLYSHGKFRSILRSAISSPPFLLSASLNLLSRSNPSPNPNPNDLSDRTGVRIQNLSLSLRNAAADVDTFVASSSLKLLSSRKKGDSLVLPNLDLKIAIESVRIALDIIYEKRFATFAYGGRAGVGRHTAVRYLRSSVRNPTWWFRLALRRQPFDLRHVHRLTAVIGEKVDDPELVQLVESLFRSEVLRVEVGGVGNGKGFPQESDLNSILLNIYFDGLDREIQEIRAEVHRKNPRMDDSTVLHKPVRVHAVRYLDELLVITSGSKLLTMDIKERILKYIENKLELKVDRLGSSVHSAVSEKMDFMGFELQAVVPSVLHPPMSEKAMRAKKMYLKRKAARALEMKNARETVRKKLGLKILNHVFKKLKKCGGFKFDFRIESEVREIFREWGEGVVTEFFKSREECRDWHRMLTAGDFLSLKRVRDQLPQELVDSYDQLQDKVNEYMMPFKSKILEEEDSQDEEVEEDKKYAKRTVEDLTELRVRVNAPVELVRKAVKLAKFTNAMGRPRPIKLLLCLDDADIIKWYASVGRRWLDFFCCCRNIKMIKTVVNYHLRFSCLLTLAEKHESTKLEAIRHFTKDLKVAGNNDTEEIYFPTEREIRMMGDKDLSDPMPIDGALGLMLVRLAYNESSCPCLVHFCDRTDTVLYRVRLLQNRLNVDPLNEDKWVLGVGAIHESLNKKCLSLCSIHSSDLFLGRITLQDIDCTSFFDIE
ncbi:uncharacterized protein M6B38_173515 [Iris pallida]|uniref:Reverse transcriptase domain-containing protein n=1 Tax=Iris pallida TaxID=29817 RepID=A0AAX6ESQ2_IRIPA|nr:uncharacterized protein M6B38_173515 [Iris pallida]